MHAFTRRAAHAVRRSVACAALAACAGAMSASAQAQLRPPDPAAVPDSSTQAFKRADRKMMESMEAARYTGDADRDFVSHMAPHHQGAIDMAQVELKYGKDPTLRQLAARIVAAQRDEIALMERWQKAHGATP
jgi:uncharacterized protein (DUF305 family)